MTSSDWLFTKSGRFLILGVVYVDHKPPWIVMELAGEGELRGYLHKHGTDLPLSTLLLFTEQIASAMLYLAVELKVRTYRILKYWSLIG